MSAGAGQECAPGATPATPAKADRGPAAITHDEPHARATEKRQLIFAVGQSVPHPAAGVRHQAKCILDSGRAQLHLRKAQTAVVARCGLQR